MRIIINGIFAKTRKGDDTDDTIDQVGPKSAKKEDEAVKVSSSFLNGNIAAPERGDLNPYAYCITIF